MSDVEYEDKSLLVFWPSVAAGPVTLEVSPTEANPSKTAVDCCDHVIDECDRDDVNTVIVRVKDPTGYTTKVFSSGSSGQWARLPSSGTPTHSEQSIAVPVTEGDEVAVALLICVVDPASGAEVRRSQVVVIKHVPA